MQFVESLRRRFTAGMAFAEAGPATARPAPEVVVDLAGTERSPVHVSFSIHETPHHADRAGEALCMLSGDASNDSTGVVVPLGRRPGDVSRDDLIDFVRAAEGRGLVLDGFVDVEAAIDLRTGAVTWSTEPPGGERLPHAGPVVTDALRALAETGLLGPWFSPTSVHAASAVDDVEVVPSSSGAQDDVSGRSGA